MICYVFRILSQKLSKIYNNSIYVKIYHTIMYVKLVLHVIPVFQLQPPKQSQLCHPLAHLLPVYLLIHYDFDITSKDNLCL